MSAESRSPYSPTLENFHFPILSADGHLLPPPPASSRQSFIDVNDSAERPLPSPPAVTAPVLATLPHLPKRWSYEHAYEEIKVDDSSKLLYEGVDFGSDGRPERKKGYHHKSTDAVPSPKIAQVHRPTSMYQPHKAEVYRTLSVEDVDLDCEDRSSRHGHRLQ